VHGLRVVTRVAGHSRPPLAACDLRRSLKSMCEILARLNLWLASTISGELFDFDPTQVAGSGGTYSQPPIHAWPVGR